VVVRSEIRSWIDDVVAKPLEPDLFGHVVPGALERYDLPDLEKLIAPRAISVFSTMAGKVRSTDSANCGSQQSPP